MAEEIRNKHFTPWQCHDRESGVLNPDKNQACSQNTNKTMDDLVVVSCFVKERTDTFFWICLFIYLFTYLFISTIRSVYFCRVHSASVCISLVKFEYNIFVTKESKLLERRYVIKYVSSGVMMFKMIFLEIYGYIYIYMVFITAVPSVQSLC
jgi:hypothetical protein